MTQAPFHNQESFERTVEQLMDRADEQKRGEDLDKLYRYVIDSPEEVSDLASFFFMLDEDFRALVQEAVNAYRRWLKAKGRPASDQDIAEVLLRIYRTKRNLKA